MSVKVITCPTCHGESRSVTDHCHSKPAYDNIYACKNPSCNTIVFDANTNRVIHIAA